jgi:hypothetical protein
VREQIQNALDVLIGEPLWSSGRAADLEWFHFGQRRTVKGFRGEAKEVGAHALHVQCAWRILVAFGRGGRAMPDSGDHRELLLFRLVQNILDVATEKLRSRSRSMKKQSVAPSRNLWPIKRLRVTKPPVASVYFITGGHKMLKKNVM